MAEYLFEEYIDLAAQVARQLPEDDTERAAFMLELKIPELEGISERAVSAAVFVEAPIVAEALEGAVETDKKVTPYRPDSLSLRNVPIEGWYLTELQGSSYFQIQKLTEERKTEPLPVILGRDKKLHVYQRHSAPTNTSIDGFVQHRYIRETSSPANNRSLLFAYALRVSMPRLGKRTEEPA